MFSMQAGRLQGPMLLQVVQKLSEEQIPPDRLRVTDDRDLAAGPRYGHVEPAALSEEAHFVAGVGADKGEDDALFLPPLVAVH